MANRYLGCLVGLSLACVGVLAQEGEQRTSEVGPDAEIAIETSPLVPPHTEVPHEPRTPPRLQRYKVSPDDRRLDVRQGAFDRQQVRPYGQTPQDRYGKDFPN